MGTVAKAFVTFLLLALVVGAGACGVCGGIVVLNIPRGSVVQGIAMIAIGVAVIVLMALAIRALWRKRPPDA